MRFGFLVKLAFAVALVVLFDRLFPYSFAGAAVGAFAVAWGLGVALARRDVRHSRLARLALAAAGVFAAALIDEPGSLAWALFWAAVSMAALLPRTAGFDDAWAWGARLALHALTTVATPIRDIRRVARARRAARDPRALAALLALPVVGAALFVALFATANPVIAQALGDIALPSIWQLLAWAFVAIGVWPSLRPHPATIRLAARLPDPEPRLPGTSLPSVLIALALFNALFAVQNALDIVFLWSGAGLPAGTTPAQYAHQGAYPLIVTALLAGFMALAMLRPGSASAADPRARQLVTLWVVQNIILVASSGLRTLDYIGASMLTGWRIAALAWMALVAVGLGLILWRILKGRSARWLVNANALAALLVLVPCAFVDLDAIAARWNVGAGAPRSVDLCYLRGVGDGALLPLIALERRPMDPATRDRVRHVRDDIIGDLAARQATWTHWTPRGARRLAEARALLGATPPPALPIPAEAWRNCDGSIGRPAATPS